MIFSLKINARIFKNILYFYLKKKLQILFCYSSEVLWDVVILLDDDDFVFDGENLDLPKLNGSSSALIPILDSGSPVNLT